MAWWKSLIGWWRSLFGSAAVSAAPDLAPKIEPGYIAPIPPPRFPHLKKALEITGRFEGRGFDQITGNFDGMGMSVGVLQWCYGQGSLQREILQPYMTLYGDIDDHFAFPHPGIEATAYMTNSLAIRYCYDHILMGTRVRPEWVAAWRRFLTHPTTIEIQLKAAEKVAVRAEELCNRWGLKSERAFCFFFDIVTQNGSMKSVQPMAPSRTRCFQYSRRASGENAMLWAPIIETATDEMLVLYQAAWERAVLCRQAYIQDVFARKGTIALGRGHVHGELVTVG